MTVVWVVVIDDAAELEPQRPAVFAQPHQAEQHARELAGASALRDLVAPDHVQYVNATADLFVNVYETSVQGV